jgi:flagellar biosynthetic protein FlhB
MLARLLALVRDIGEADGVTAAGLGADAMNVARRSAALIAPFLAAGLVFTVLGAMLQTGFALSPQRLAFKPERLNPAEGVKRLASLESPKRLAMGLLKVGLIAAVAYYGVAAQISALLSAGGVSVEALLRIAGQVLFDLSLTLAVVLLLLGIVDYFFQRWRLEKSLKMTRQEVKDELKRMEGDPLVRRRRRELQARLAFQRAGIDVPKSDVVVTNPTEYAVALRYDEQTMGAPKVTAKGRDLLALRIRQVAQQHGIPIVQRPPLARALYTTVEVGQEVPPTLYRAVAEVLAYVYQLRPKAA